MTILYPVRQRLAAARLYAVVLPAPFTPPDALVRRVEDLVAAGVDVVQVDLTGWDHDDAVAVLNRCTPVLVPTGRLLVVGHAADVAVDLGADALLLGPAQNLPDIVVEQLGRQAAFGREVGDEVQLSGALEAPELDFIVLIGDRAGQVAERAHQLAPLAAVDASADPDSGARPWFVDLGAHWTDPGVLPARPCRVRFQVQVPADSPIDQPSEQLRGDAAGLAARVSALWDGDEELAAVRREVFAENAEASSTFRTPVGDDGTVGPYDTEAVRSYGRDSRSEGRHPIRDLIDRAFRRRSAEEE